MTAVSVTSKGQVTIPKPIRDQLGITKGSRIEFELAGNDARIHLVRKGQSSRIEDGPAILNYQGPRIPTGKLDGAVAMKKTGRARR